MRHIGHCQFISHFSCSVKQKQIVLFKLLVSGFSDVVKCHGFSGSLSY